MHLVKIAYPILNWKGKQSQALAILFFCFCLYVMQQQFECMDLILLILYHK